MFCVERVPSATRGNVDLGRNRKSDKNAIPCGSLVACLYLSANDRQKRIST